MTHHVLDGSETHAWFDRDDPARLEIDPGDTVTFELREPLDGQMTPETKVADLLAIDGSRAHSLLGPVAVRGAQAGDTLEVEILEFAHRGWGWTGWLPGMGLLAEDFPEPHLQHWRLEGRSCFFRDSG
ncbi:MAG: acetamidase/formamidase family protein, partial [Trueperaceae bacterium]